MSRNKLRLVFRDSLVRVFLPNGEEMRQVISAKIKTGGGEIPVLTLEIADFEVDGQAEADRPSAAELASFGLKPEDIEDSE